MAVEYYEEYEVGAAYETARETSKPDRGVVTFDQQVVNSNGEVLLLFTVNRMIRRRPDA